MSVDQFVIIVDKFPCIYNRDSPDYARNDATEEAWKEIADEIEWTVTECKKTWNEILKDYSEFLNYNGSNGVSKNLYHLCKDLRFLLPHAPKPVNTYKRRAPSPLEEREIPKVERYKRRIPSPLEEREEPSFKKFKMKETESSSSDDDTAEVNDTRKMFLLSLLTDLETMSDKKMGLFRIEALMLLKKIQERHS